MDDFRPRQLTFCAMAGIAALLVCRTGLALPRPNAGSGALAWLAKGISAYRAGRLSEARRDLETAIEADPRLAAAHAYLGLAFARTGSQSAALRELERAHALDPRNPGYAYDAALLLIETKRYPSAADILQKLSQQKPPPKDVLVNLARAEAGAGESAKVAALVSHLPASYYADAGFLQALAGVLAEARQFAPLEQLWKSAIHRAPDQALPYAALAELYVAGGDATQALSALDTAPAAARDPVYWYAYGQAQLALRRYAQAAGIFQRLTKSIPQNERAWTGLIQAQMLDGRLSDASASASEALIRLPKSAALRYQAGLVNYLLGRNAAALAALQPLLQRGGEDADTRPVLLAAVAESASGNYTQAVEYFKEVLSAQGACNALAEYFYGATLLRMRKPAHAATQLKDAVNCRPHFALAEYRLGQALLQMQRVKMAEAELEEAIRDEPGLAEPYYALAQLERRQGDAKGAAAALQRFSELHQHADRADRRLLEGLSGEIHSAATERSRSDSPSR